jgi:hypothetical protein
VGESLRGTHIVETEKCMILESCRVSRLRPTVRLVLLFGIATNHGHDASGEQEALRERRQHAPLPEIIRSISSEQIQRSCRRVVLRMARKLALLNKERHLHPERAGHTSVPLQMTVLQVEWKILILQGAIKNELSGKLGGQWCLSKNHRRNAAI